MEWALKSIEFAFSRGVGCVSVIPTRGGNGNMELFQRDGLYAPPTLASLESVLERGLELAQRFPATPRVFADLWDAEKFAACSHCAAERVGRLNEMNLSQQGAPTVECPQCEIR